jgi:hypothetical protein
VHKTGRILNTRSGTPSFSDTTNLDGVIPVLIKNTTGKSCKMISYAGGPFLYCGYDSLCYQPLYDGEIYLFKYYENLGGPYYQASYYLFYQHERTLKGFSDSTQTWGILKTCGEILSVEENNELSFKLFPNPVKDVLDIEFETPQTGIVRIFDAKGSLIFNLNIENQDRIEIKSAEFPAGIYILQFNGNSNGSVVFIKE